MSLTEGGAPSSLDVLRVVQAPENESVFRRRLENVEWIRGLRRDGLRNGVEEKRILLRETKGGERVFLQYPGKESELPEAKKKELDFRPKLMDANGSWLEDQSFADVWDALQECAAGVYGPWAPRALGTLIFRMAHFIDFHRDDEDIMLQTETEGFGLASHPALRATETLHPFWRYNPPAEALAALGRIYKVISGATLEAFLYYNQILAWNEDCKYLGPLGDASPKHFRRGSNNLLTHLRVLGVLTGDVRFSKVLYPLSKIGVSPATVTEAKLICRPWLDGMS
ncbi:MAG: hypothetical protein OK422_04370 [Thaumarchaeota archaeon]|nr:hypothetical protein [Nitrososphaerota archaeon]